MNVLQIKCLVEKLRVLSKILNPRFEEKRCLMASTINHGISLSNPKKRAQLKHETPKDAVQTVLLESDKAKFLR